MLFQESTQQIVNKLLTTPNIPSILQENDDKYIEWKRIEMLRKLPKEIRPLEDKIQEKQKVVFSAMLNNVQQKAYTSSKPDFNMVLKLMDEHEKPQNFLLGKSSLKSEPKQQEESRRQEKQQVQEKQELSKSKKSISSAKRSQSQAAKSSKVEVTPEILLKSYTPFIPNSQNPYDRHANSKMLKQKFSHVQFNDSMRNITAIIQNNKKKNDFKNSPMVQTLMTQQKTSNKFMSQPLNVTNVLKYTLGDKRQRQMGVKPEPIANPFVKVPPKFSESLNDFYKT